MQDIESRLAPVLRSFVGACLEVFGASEVAGVVLHGSAAKGDFIAGFSDVDLVVYLSSACFGRPGVVRDDLAFAFQARSGGLPWHEAGAAYPQVVFRDALGADDWWTSPGGYRVLHGALPALAIGTAQQARISASRTLAEWLTRVTDTDVADFAEITDDLLPRRLRLLGTRLKPVLFSLVSYDQPDAAALWTETRAQAIQRLRRCFAGEPGPEYAAAFYVAVATLFSGGWDVGQARETFRTGVAFLRWAESVLPPAAVTIVEHDRGWAELFEAEKHRLVAIVGDAVSDIQHVGSTSVQALVAKPIVDVLLLLRRPLLDAEIAVVAAPGYEYRGEQGSPGRQYFSRRTAPAFHIHGFVAGNPEAARMLRFRDYLRTHADAARQYEALKRRLAVDFRWDREGYQAGKTAFIEAIDDGAASDVAFST